MIDLAKADVSSISDKVISDFGISSCSEVIHIYRDNKAQSFVCMSSGAFIEEISLFVEIFFQELRNHFYHKNLYYRYA